MIRGVKRKRENSSLEKCEKKGRKVDPQNVESKFSKPALPKTDWRVLKAEKKELKIARKKSKSYYDVSSEAKQLYEQLNSKKIEKSKKLSVSEDLYSLLKKSDCLRKFVMAHDTARVIQCLFKHSPKEIKKSIVEELSTVSCDMATSKYAHYCVMRILKYGDTSNKEKIINSFYGNIVRLTSHVISSKIIDHVFLNLANPKQKAEMKQEFYGDIYKKQKDSSIRNLSDVYKDAKDHKVATLNAVKANLEHVANKTLVDSSLVHAVLFEYLEESSEPNRAEIVSLYAPLIPHLVTTKKGCRSAILCFWYSPTKERRAIVKSLREHLEKICVHEQGYLLILAIINTMDDTKAIRKVIFDPLVACIETLMQNTSGRKVIEWFISPADTEVFHPSLISFLDSGLQFSKKEKDIRRKEIFDSIEEPLCVHICENISFWFSDGHKAAMIGSILKKMSPTNFSKVSENIAKLIVNPDWKTQTSHEMTPLIGNVSKVSEPNVKEAVLGIEDAGLHIALKKIIKHDKERATSGAPTFSASLSKYLTTENMLCWIKINRACFILVNVVENSAEFVKSHIKDILTIDENLAALKSQTHAGAKLLLDKLNLHDK